METFLDFIRDQLGSPGLSILLSNPNFAFIQLLNSISMGMNYFIIAAGLSLIFGVLKVINFAHGAFYMFGAYITYSVTEILGLGFFWGSGSCTGPYGHGLRHRTVSVPFYL